MSKPSVICPLCALDEYLTHEALLDDQWLITCNNPTHREWSWMAFPEDPTGAVAEGLAAELGLFEKLAPLIDDDAYDEYGIVEYRFGIAYPQDYAFLLATFGHRAERIGRPHTLSAFLAGVLGRMGKADEVTQGGSKATGYWSYLGEVSYWTRAISLPPHLPYKAWVEFASAKGIDPATWPLVSPA
ncbi:MAG: hypothetical protein HY876_08140 [Coriobacteriales bacterium]|nr:hypothetical protein [Coriobacteriales bacterium]